MSVLILISLLQYTTAMTCDKGILLNGVGVSTALGAIQEFGQTYAAKRSTLLGTKVSFDYESVSSSVTWARVLKNSNDNKTSLFAFTDPPTGDVATSANWATIPLTAGCLGIIFNIPLVTQLNMTFELLADIYMGNISRWDDIRIGNLNPKLKLPSQPIVPIGRYERSGDTEDFTRALSAFNVGWKNDFGQFDSPDFYGGICCNSSKWPSAVKLFGSRVTGAIGIVGSIPYTIGYASSINSALNNISLATVANYQGNLVNPDIIAVQSAMNYWATRRNNIGSDLSGALSFDAYPIVVSYHMSFINTSDNQPSIDCCAIRELVGFVQFLIEDDIQILIETKYYMTGISHVLKELINNTILTKLTCNGENVYQAYLQTLTSASSNIPTVPLLVGILVSLVVICLLISAICYWHNRRKYLVSISSWLIAPERLKPTKETIPNAIAMSAVSISHLTSSTARCSNLEEFSTYLLGEQTVVTHKLPPFDVKKMNLRTKRLLYQFQKEFHHENLLPFTGIVAAQPQFISLSLFNGKSTLHHLIHYSNYELTNEIRYNFASDVCQGMKFLHSRQIPHRLLNSLNCYVDRSWRVRLGQWHFASVLQFETRRELRSLLTSTEFPADKERLVGLLYVDPLAHKDFLFSHHADAYSFGLLLLELFSQLLPFESEVDLQMLSFGDVLHRKFVLMDFTKPEIPPNVPPVIRQLIGNCLAERNNRLHFKAIETSIRQCRQSPKGIIDLLMDTMESYMSDLENRVAERTVAITNLNAKLQSLLNEVLPAEIATRLLKGEEVKPEHFDSVSIYFSDIVGFTIISSQSTPIQVMQLLNDLWTVFDKTVESFDAYKVDTIGDAYMICSGLPKPNGVLHAKVIAQLSLALLDKVKSFTIRHKPNQQLQIRIGINSGPVTAGIVGSKMPQYCVFGDTVNTASRMESSGIPMKIQIAESTFELLSNNYSSDFQLTARGEVEVKGKGLMKTYWLELPG